MKKYFFILIAGIFAACTPEQYYVEPAEPGPEPFELSARGLATMFASLPMGAEQLREVYQAVGHSSNNGYDEEYTLDSLLLKPGAGVGPGTKARPTGTPLREMVRGYLEEHASTRSGIDDLMELIAESGYQLYWPYSEDWDGISYPVITFDPGYGAESNYGFELSPSPSGAIITDTLTVDEALAQLRPVWVINSNSDAAFTPLELFAPAAQTAVYDYPPAPPGDGGKDSPARLAPSPFGRPSASELLSNSIRDDSGVTETGSILQNCGRPWPHERGGPTSGAQWGGRSEAEVLQNTFSAVKPESSRPRRLMLKSFRMLRNYDSWFGGASEFWIKCGSVEGFSAATEAELQLYSPSITDFMIVVKRRDINKEVPYEAIMVSDFSTQLDKIAFLVVEDDGGTRTGWKCEATVKIQSKSYGVSLDIPYNEKDDIVWRGQLSARFFEEEDIVTGRFGDVICSFELE
ncbi:MAG: hypothetical protein J5759_05530 [Bacteroidales bacterium]|nr:hypothetical protein [Bacteroidales bacterium]